MQRYLSRLTLTVLLALTATLPLSAGDHIDDIYEMSLDENLMSPEIKNDRQADKIQEFQYDMAVAFKRTNYEVEIMRDDEVIVITIPAMQVEYDGALYYGFGANTDIVTASVEAYIDCINKFKKEDE